MSRGPAKISIRVDGDDSEAVAAEALRVYTSMVEQVDMMDGGAET